MIGWWAASAIGWAAAPIVGGVPGGSPTDPVVALVDDGVAFCTGALIDDTWVLTAGHCVTLAPAGFEVWWGADLVDSGPTATSAVVRTVVHPDDAFDVALIELATGSISDRAVLAGAPPGIGASLEARGFGVTTDGGDDGGVKRVATVEVIDVGPEVVRTFGGTANLCSGDSGAPLFTPGSSPLEIAAIGAFVDPTCVGGTAGSTRADAIRAFVDGYVPIATGTTGTGTGTG
ncbi:MAG: trypsin-like serine protease, partial [Myxococcota bacterium]